MSVVSVDVHSNVCFPFGSMVNAQPCTMGGSNDYGVEIATKSQAIDKAREELRKKCDVREERMRELEFLEKGGNPLDFEFAHVAMASVPSTTLTNQRAEQNVMSEAKSSFAASPHGDSLYSNDRPGSSLSHETNTADGGGKSDIVGDEVVKRGTKRSNAAQPKQSLSTDSNKSARRTEDSGLSKSQAYVRRNRSKPSRESANVSSMRSSVTPAEGSEPRDENGVAQSKIADEPVSSSAKPAGSFSDNAPPKNTGSDDQAAMELDGFQNVRESDSVAKNESKADEVASVETPGAGQNVFMGQCDSSASTRDERESCAGDEKADDSNFDQCVGHIHVGELDKKRADPACAVEDPGIHKNAVDPLCEGTKIIVDDHLAADMNLVATKVDGKSQDDLNISRYSNKTLKESGQTERLIGSTSVEVNMDHVQPESSNTCLVKDVVEVCDSAIQKDTGCPSSGHSMNIEGSPDSDRKNENCLSSPISARPTAVGTDLPKNYVPDAIPSPKSDEPNMENEIKKSENLDKMATKAYEDSILRKARTIETSIKRAGERSLRNTSLEKRRKGHWDFVLEEMAWMANDFMQERLWKSVAAAQMCRWIASDGRAKFEEANILRKQKTIMKSLTKSIMSFWHSAEASRTARRTAVMQEHNSTMLEETKASGIKADKENGNKPLVAGESLRPRQSQIQDYAIRFLEYNCKIANSVVLAEAPPTPERLNDFGILKVSDQLSKESLFYTVATGAMMAYRESVESLSEYHKRAGNTEHMDEYEASVCDSAADFPQEDTYEEDEGATEAYEGGFISKMCDKKKHQMHQRIRGARQYEIGTYVPYEPCLESKSGNCPLLPNGKRSSFLSVPAKRSRTTARQRVVSPFHASATRAPCATSMTDDASSGDTNSIPDDESSLHGGSLQWRNMDYESIVDFDRESPYDAVKVPTKANKKKKLNNPGYNTAQNTANSFALASNHMYDRRLQVDNYLKKRPESHQYNSNGIYAANGVQHASKKLKVMKQEIDNSPEASRVASQMSNMANPVRFIGIIANRERGKKCKALKMTSSDGWSSFEDQALVVLVHDMGQNWELICDAINSIVQFKTIHRQPNECKERHKVLMDRSSGDGADSAEDCGSSQRYHNSLPGIPKGSARQLFKRLQEPFEEENLKEHFGKIILLMQQVHSRHRQVNSQELKPIMQPHSSHVIALPQICVNKIPGGCLTPLDLCDPISPNVDSMTPGSLSLGSHTNGLTLSNQQNSAGPTTPTSNLSSRLPGSPGMVLGLGNNSPSSSTWNSHRDAQKYDIPRQGDEQPMTQNNQVVSDRNFQQPGGSVPGVFPIGNDHGGRTMPGSQMAGLNRGMPVAKAGIPRISAPGGLAVSPRNLVPNSGQGVPGPVKFHHGGIPVQQPQQPQKMSKSSHIFGNPDHSQMQGASASPQQRQYALHLPNERRTQQHTVSQQYSDISGASAVSCVQSGSHIVQQNQLSAVNPVPCLQPQHQRQQAPQNPQVASSSPNVPTTATLQKQKKQGQQQSRQNLQQRNQGSQQAKLMKSLGRGNMVIPLTPSVDDMPANAISTPSKKHMPDKKLMQRGQELPPANTAPTPSMLRPLNQPKQYAMLPQSMKQLPDNGNQSEMQVSSTRTLSDSQQPPVQSKSALTTQQQQKQIIPSQNGVQRTIMQQNCQMSSECRTDTYPKRVQHNQMVPATSVPPSTDSGNPLVSSVNPPKREASHNPASVNSSSNLLSSPSNTSFGNETLLPSSGQDVQQRQVSGVFPMQSQVVGQWNQQARQQLQSQHQQTPIVVQGSVYAPSNSGSG